jgi:hypothetical protein
MRLVMERYGYPEETWWTFAYSPTRDESGTLVGLFCSYTENTKQVLALRALRESDDNLEPGLHVLTKPFRMEALANRIKELIGEA